MKEFTTAFAITNVDAGGSPGDIDSIGLLLPDGSGERAWIDLETNDYFRTAEAVDVAGLGRFLAWALNRLRAGDHIVAVEVDDPERQLSILVEPIDDGSEPEDVAYESAPAVTFRAPAESEA